MKKFLLSLMITIVLLLGGQTTVKSQTTLAAGDIAFIGLYMDGNATSGDGFTFILLKSVDAGTVIYFTDEGWDASSHNTWYGNSNDAHLTWTAPSGGSSIGTIVHIENTAANTFSTTSGTVSYANGSWNLSSSGDQILAYQSSTGARPASPSFIAATDADYYNTYDGMNGWTTSYDINTINYACYLPPGLTNGTNCVALVNGTTAVAGGYAVGYECDNYKYTGTLTGSVDAIRIAINTTSNWTGNEDGSMNIAVASYSTPSISTDNPEINITGNGQPINDGDATTSTTNHTDFGSVAVDGGTMVRTFTISNSGTGALNLTGSPIVVSSSGEFIVTQPASSTVAAGGSITFQVTFDPSASGTRTATLSIANNDANENPYNFSIQGVGTAPEPEMSVSGNSVEILDGDATPSTSDHTDYGLADINTGSVTYTYTISNQGLATLTLSGSPIVSSSSSDFTITQPSVSSIAASGSITFQVTFNPTATGTRTATISIANNDSNENPYNFTVQGYGTSQNLSAGDIAFIGYNSDDPDGFTFITLNNLPSTEMIYFTEEGWNGSAWSGSSTETHYAWQAPVGGLSIGSIVYIYESSANVLTASTGTISGMLSGSTFNFSGGDQVLAYQSGSGVKPTSPTFIAGVHADYFSTNYNSTTTWSQSASAGEQNASTVPTGLTNGVNCVSLFPATTEQDNAKYNGTLTGNSNAIRTAINTYTNWISKSDTYYDISPTGYTTPSITLAAEINLLGNSVTIADDDAIPSVTDDTDFGSVAVSGGTVSHTFTIQNTGSLTLNLTGTPIVSIPTSDFAITTQPSGTTIASGGSLTFTVEFNPTAVGTRTATISIANDDGDENPYNFAIQGTGDPAGAGTIGDPYLISNLDELKWVAVQTNSGNTFSGKYLKQTADIGISSISNWTKIGTSTTVCFSGTYDGDGHKITGLSITSTTDSYNGLFGVIGAGGTVKNLGVTGAILSGSTAGLGILAGYNFGGTVENCYTTGTVTTSHNNPGGLLGTSTGTVTKCYSTATVTATGATSSNVGGLIGAGLNTSGSISQCYSTGNVSNNNTSGSYNTGGFIGIAVHDLDKQ